MDTKVPRLRDLRDVLDDVERLVQNHRKNHSSDSLTIKDFRREFDQESAKMNQAIFNDQDDQIRETCLNTVISLIEILSRA